MMPLQLHCLIVLVLSGGCTAWSTSWISSSSRAAVTPTQTADNRVGKSDDDDDADAHILLGTSSKSTSRREALRQTVFATTTLAMYASSLIPILPAYADVTNKIASSPALESLARVQRQLPTKLLPPAQSNEYLGVKTALRDPSFNSLRKDMLILVRGGEDGPKAGELRTAYAQLIKSLEAIDATSSLGMQGRTKTIDPFQLGVQYEEITNAMELFIQVGSDAAGIPLMEDTKQTQVGSIDVRSGKVTERSI